MAAPIMLQDFTIAADVQRVAFCCGLDIMHTRHICSIGFVLMQDGSFHLQLGRLDASYFKVNCVDA